MSRAICALSATFALAAVVTGAAHALLTMPAFVLAAGAVALLWPAALRPRPGIVLAMIVGGVLGAQLPRVAPMAAGAIVSRPIGVRATGDLFALLERLDADPASVLGRDVTVSGSFQPAGGGHAASVYRRVMTCCAADAVNVGFDVEPRSGSSPCGRDCAQNESVRVSGVVRSSLRGGELRYRLADATVCAVRPAAPSATRAHPRHGRPRLRSATPCG